MGSNPAETKKFFSSKIKMYRQNNQFGLGLTFLEQKFTELFKFEMSKFGSVHPVFESKHNCRFNSIDKCNFMNSIFQFGLFNNLKDSLRVDFSSRVAGRAEATSRFLSYHFSFCSPQIKVFSDVLLFHSSDNIWTKV